MLEKIFPELNKERKKDIGSAVRLKEMVAVLRKYEVVRGMTPEKLMEPTNCRSAFSGSATVTSKAVPSPLLRMTKL